MRHHIEIYLTPLRLTSREVRKDLCSLAAAFALAAGIGAVSLAALDHDLSAAVSNGEPS